MRRGAPKRLKRVWIECSHPFGIGIAIGIGIDIGGHFDSDDDSDHDTDSDRDISSIFETEIGTHPVPLSTVYSPYISVMIRRNRDASSSERIPILDPSRHLLIVRI